jgi:hypothetical protein
MGRSQRIDPGLLIEVGHEAHLAHVGLQLRGGLARLSWRGRMILGHGDDSSCGRHCAYGRLGCDFNQVNGPVNGLTPDTEEWQKS